MHSDCLCSRFHPNFSVKIYQLLKKWIFNAHIVLEEMFICPFLPSCLPSNHSKMAVALVFVRVSMIKCKNNPLCQKFWGRERSKQERKNGDVCINKGNGVSGNNSFIHHFYTPEDGHRWDPDSLCTYAAQQSYHDT